MAFDRDLSRWLYFFSSKRIRVGVLFPPYQLYSVLRFSAFVCRTRLVTVSEEFYTWVPFFVGFLFFKKKKIQEILTPLPPFSFTTRTRISSSQAGKTMSWKRKGKEPSSRARPLFSRAPFPATRPSGLAGGGSGVSIRSPTRTLR